MSLVQISGNASGTGTLTIAAPNTNSNYTLTLPAATTTLVGTDATQTLTNKTLTSPTLTSPTITGAVVSSMASSVITSGTAVASTSNTSIDFTGLPTWVKRITVMFDGVSTSGTSAISIQLGDAGGVENTGYVSTGQNVATTSVTATTPTTVFALMAAAGAATAYSGVAYLSLLNSSTNTWVMTSGLTAGGSTVLTGYGSKSLSATLDRVRITAANGTDTFDAGTINILYE